MNRPITIELENLIQRQIDTGHYASAEEVLTALRDLLGNEQAVKAFQAGWLKREIQKGIDSGGDIPAETVFDEVRHIVMAEQAHAFKDILVTVF